MEDKKKLATIEDIQKIIDSSISANNAIDRKTHYKHHQLIEAIIEEKQTRKKRIEAIITQLSGWGAVAGFVWVGQVVAKKLGITF